MHQYANKPKASVFHYLTRINSDIVIYDIAGSTFYNPETSFSKAKKNVSNHKKIILGFKIENNSSRWLTHHEISLGTYQAIHASKEKFIIGITTPWEKRP